MRVRQGVQAMQWLIDWGVRFGRLVMAVALGLIIIGATQLRSAPVDVYPEFDPPAVQIQTEALGLSAVEVEQLITVPIEQDLLNGVPWMDRIHSVSMPGLSAIDMTFQPGTNLFAARQMVEERMTQAHALPNVGSPPIMIQPLSSLSRVAMIRLSSRSVSPIDMSVLARWKIRPRLMGVPGVANVAPRRAPGPGAACREGLGRLWRPRLRYLVRYDQHALAQCRGQAPMS
jgi:Cu/Ag efflux pump CusA